MLTGTSHDHQPSTMFERLYQMAYSTLVAQAKGILKERQGAEDIVSDVLLLASQWENSEGRSDLLADMESEVREQCQRLLEEEKRLVYLGACKDATLAGLEVSECKGSTDKAAVLVNLNLSANTAQKAISIPLRVVHEVFASLPAKYQRVLWLRILDGKSEEETSGALNVSNWVMSQQFDAARRTMKRRLREEATLQLYLS